MSDEGFERFFREPPSGMTRKGFEEFFREQLADDDAHAARQACCLTVTEAIAYAGKVLHAGGYMLRDERADGLGLAERIGGSLASGACELLATGNAYAAAALIRQLVEVEYLLWTFADDPEDASRWINASKSQLESTLRPATMRKRSAGRFRSGEYRTHCERGGHPTPHGRFLVSATGPVDPVRGTWADLGHHFASAWTLLVRACDRVGYGMASEQRAEAVE